MIWQLFLKLGFDDHTFFAVGLTYFSCPFGANHPLLCHARRGQGRQHYRRCWEDAFLVCLPGNDAADSLPSRSLLEGRTDIVAAISVFPAVPSDLVRSTSRRGWVWLLGLKFSIGPPFTLQALRWGSLMVFNAVVISVLYVRWISAAPSRKAKSSDSRSRSLENEFASLAKDWEVLQRWIRTEAAITSPEQDLFDLYGIARRFASNLLQPLGEANQSFGLIGPFGSGKTSFINLVSYELKLIRKARDPQVWICKLSCWGFDDSTAALQHVLTQAVRTIGEYVDCSGLRGLPEAYRRALSSGRDSWRLLMDLFGRETDPTSQLHRLTPILEAVNARLVIVLEDVDRNRSA
jgi:KAP family P-loop domain